MDKRKLVTRSASPSIRLDHECRSNSDSVGFDRTTNREDKELVDDTLEPTSTGQDSADCECDDIIIEKDWQVKANLANARGCAFLPVMDGSVADLGCEDNWRVTTVDGGCSSGLPLTAESIDDGWSGTLTDWDKFEIDAGAEASLTWHVTSDIVSGSSSNRTTFSSSITTVDNGVDFTSPVWDWVGYDIDSTAIDAIDSAYISGSLPIALYATNSSTLKCCIASTSVGNSWGTPKTVVTGVDFGSVVRAKIVHLPYGPGVGVFFVDETGGIVSLKYTYALLFGNILGTFSTPITLTSLELDTTWGLESYNHLAAEVIDGYPAIAYRSYTEIDPSPDGSEDTYIHNQIKYIVANDHFPTSIGDWESPEVVFTCEVPVTPIPFYADKIEQIFGLDLVSIEDTPSIFFGHLINSGSVDYFLEFVQRSGSWGGPIPLDSGGGLAVDYVSAYWDFTFGVGVAYGNKYVYSEDAVTWETPNTVGAFASLTDVSVVARQYPTSTKVPTIFTVEGGDVNLYYGADAEGTSFTLDSTLEASDAEGAIRARVWGSPSYAWGAFYVYDGAPRVVLRELLSGTSYDLDLYPYLSANFNSSGHPAVSYYSATNQELYYAAASDVQGSTWSDRILVDTSSNVGQYCSLTKHPSNSRPYITYYDATSNNLKLAISNNTSGTSWTLDSLGDNNSGKWSKITFVGTTPWMAYVTPDNASIYEVSYSSGFGSPSLIYSGTNIKIGSYGIVDGNRAIVFVDNGTLKYTYRTTSWQTPITIDTGLTAPFADAELGVIDGLPAIGYATPSAIKFVVADDATGSAWSATPTTVTSVLANSVRNISFSVVSLGGTDRAFLSYWSDESLYYVESKDETGLTWYAVSTISGAFNSSTDADSYTSNVSNSTNVGIGFVAVTGSVGQVFYISGSNSSSFNVKGIYPSAALVDGNPAIAYYDQFQGSIYYLRADDSQGTTWSGPEVSILPTSELGFDLDQPQSISLAIINGNPAVAFLKKTGSSSYSVRYIRSSTVDGLTGPWDTASVEVGTTNVSSDNAKLVQLLEVDGEPAIGFYDNPALRYVRYSGGWPSSQHVGVCGFGWDFAEINALPAVALDDPIDNLLEYGLGNLAGSAWAFVTADAGLAFGRSIDLEVIAGNPAIAYSNNGFLEYIRNEDPDGLGVWSSAASLDGVDVESCKLYTILGRPAIAFLSVSDFLPVLDRSSDAYFLRANDALGASWPVSATLVTSPSDQSYISDLIALDVAADEGPAFAVHSTDSGLASSGTKWAYASVVSSNTYRGKYIDVSELGDGTPCVAYVGDTDTDSDVLFYAEANDALGTTWTVSAPIYNALPVSALSLEKNRIAFLSGGTLRYTYFTTGWNFVNIGSATGLMDLQEVAGRPAIAYRDASNLYFIRANDANGSSWPASPVTVASGAGIADYLSLAVIDGNPAIAYEDGGSLKYVRASDINGAGWGAASTLDTGDVGAYCRLSVVDGLPSIGYKDVANGDLKAIQATTVSGSAWGSPMVALAGVDAGDYVTVTDINDCMALVYRNATSEALEYVQQEAPNANVWLAPAVVDDSEISNGFYCSNYSTNNKLSVAYANEDGSGVGVARYATYTSLFEAESLGWHVSSAENELSNDFCVSAYNETSGELIKYQRDKAIAWAGGSVIEATTGALTFTMPVSTGFGIFYDSSGTLKYFYSGSPLALDTAFDATTGLGASIVDGVPAAAYNAGGTLTFIKASDVTGSAWGTPVDVGVTTAEFINLININDKPAIIYYDNGDTRLKIVRAINTSGTAWHPPVSITGANAGTYASAVIVDAIPSVAYFNTASNNIEFRRASNEDGDTWNGAIIVEPAIGLTKLNLNVADRLIISYVDSEALFVESTDKTGTVWGGAQTIENFSTDISGTRRGPLFAAGFQTVNYTKGNVNFVFEDAADCDSLGLWPSSVEVDGFPAVSFYHATNDALMYVRALDVEGLAWDAPVEVHADGGTRSCLLVVNGNPAIAFVDNLNRLCFVRANDATGSTWGAAVVVDSDSVYFAAGSAHVSMALVSNKPAIAYCKTVAGPSITVKFVLASDINGLAWGTPSVIETVSSNLSRAFASLTVHDGLPYVGLHSSALKIAKGNATGTSWTLTQLSFDESPKALSTGDHLFLFALSSSNNIVTYRSEDGTSFEEIEVVSSSNVGAIDFVASSGQLLGVFRNSTGVYSLRSTDLTGDIWGSARLVDACSSHTLSIAVINGLSAVAFPKLIVGTKYSLMYAMTDECDSVGQYCDAHLVLSKPAIAYYDETDKALMYVRSSDHSGEQWNVPVNVDDFGDVGVYCDLHVCGGKPVIAYGNAVTGAVRFVASLDHEGEEWGAPVTAHSGVDTTLHDISLTMIAEKPAIAFARDGGLLFSYASDTYGGSWTTNSVNGEVANKIKLLEFDHKPMLLYLVSGALKYATATDAAGATWSAATTLATSVLTFDAAIVDEVCSVAILKSDGKVEYRISDNVTGNLWSDWLELALASTPSAMLGLVDTGEEVAVAYVDGLAIKAIMSKDVIGHEWEELFTLEALLEPVTYMSLLALEDGKLSVSYA